MLVEKITTRLEEAENENRVLKRRHIASIKVIIMVALYLFVSISVLYNQYAAAT